MSRESNQPPAIALIGCGAIAEAFHLPALLRHEDVRSRLVLVDPATDRTGELVERHGLGAACADHREILDRVGGAIVAVPAHLHHPIAHDCLERGIDVLCEKPLCESPVEARELVEIAERAGAVLAVNQTRRLFPAFQQVKRLIADGAIGELRRLSYVLGEPFDWPAATHSYFGAHGSGKGVLLDIGAHIIDLVCWWLGGRPEVVDYHDDSHGGTEAVVQLDLAHERCRASIRLSWLSKLANTYCVEGDRGSLSGEVYEWSSFTRTSPDGQSRKVRTPDRPAGFEDFAYRLIDNFVDVVRSVAPPLVPGREVLPSLEIIDECYERRRHFDQPWHDTVARLAHG